MLLPLVALFLMLVAIPMLFSSTFKGFVIGVIGFAAAFMIMIVDVWQYANYHEMKMQRGAVPMGVTAKAPR